MFQNAWWAVLRRQTLCFVLIAGAGLALTLLVILFAPRKYQSEARLLLRLGRENISIDPTVTSAGDPMNFHQTRDNEVNTLLEAMKSRNVLEAVIDDVGDDAVLRGSLDDSKSGGLLSGLKSFVGGMISGIDPVDDRERAMIELQKGLDIDAGRQSSVVKIQYKTKTAELAQRVTQSWVDAYRDEHAQMNATQGSLEFFDRQDSQLLESLQAARERLRLVKSKYGIVTVEGKQANLESQLQWARAMVVQNQAALAGAQAKLGSFSRLRDETSATIVTSEIRTDTNEAQNQMRNRLYDLEIEERRLASVYTTDHPAYRVVAKQLEEAREVFQKQGAESGEVTQGINPLHTVIMEQWSELVSQVAAHEAELSSTQSILVQLQEELVAMNDQEAEVAVLQQELEVLEAEYRNHFEKREQARFAAELRDSQISNINVIQSASLQQKPVSPNKLICGLLGTAGSLFTAFGVVLLRESLFVDQVSDRQLTRIDTIPPTEIQEKTFERPLSRLVEEMKQGEQTDEHLEHDCVKDDLITDDLIKDAAESNEVSIRHPLHR